MDDRIDVPEDTNNNKVIAEEAFDGANVTKQ